MRRAKGFTLIELMVAMMVLAVGILVILLANTYVQHASQGIYERMVATQDGHRVIELMRNASVTGNFPNNVTAAFPHGGAVAGFANLTNEQAVVTYTDSTADPLDVTVTITWREQGVRNATNQLRTLLTQRQ